MVDPKIAYTSTFLNLTRLAVSLAYMNVVVCPILYVAERKRKFSKIRLKWTNGKSNLKQKLT